MPLIYEQVTVTVAAGAEGLEDVFESTSVVKRKLVKLSVNATTADVDLLVRDDREDIADIPIDTLAIADTWIEFNRDIIEGHTLAAGFRNGTAGGVTIDICVCSEIPE